MSANESALLRNLPGRWRGTVRTWLEPESSPLSGEYVATFRAVMGGSTIQQEYESTVGEHRSDGVALLGKDIATGKLCLAWLDTFHTSAHLMLFASEGDPAADEVSLRGEYAAGTETWGWRITYHRSDGGELTIRHFNITPSGEEALAVEVVCARQPGA